MMDPMGTAGSTAAAGEGSELDEPLAPPGGHELLEVRDLAVDVRGEREWVTIVDGVDLRIGAGETVGLVGESGCGKTVTSLAVMQLLPDDARLRGSIRLDGRELAGLGRRELRRVRGAEMAMIFQEPRRSLNPAFTVGDQVAESLRHHRGLSRREAWRGVVELFELVEIPDAERRAREYPHEFSGGMCQRVMLAIAIACEPKILLADEPTTALDVTVQRQVLELVFGLQERLGLGVLLITHDLAVVAEVCDRAAVMYAGKIVEEAPIVELFDAPRHPYTAGLLRSMPDPTRSGERMGRIPGVVPPPQAYPSGCRFHPRCPFAVSSRCAEVDVELRTMGSSSHLVRCVRAEELDLDLDLRRAFDE